ncbi:hypothetical protein BHE74_00024867 [Ensete ventricosum]|nr:hypothetical protein GW17_00019702 [Ensete ventricosum]RWW67668.1 hypothetical protein BHE74_00024867 [Ensete ventricosum]RZR85432.1 hypothetical protein BHM03_00012403 [Ensete ventricosum]
MTLMDAKAFKVLMVIRLCHDYNSIVTVQCLADVWERYSILREYELHIPLPGQHPYDAFSNSFRLSTDALEIWWIFRESRASLRADLLVNLRHHLPKKHLSQWSRSAPLKGVVVRTLAMEVLM